jgi:chlorophyllase
MRGSELVIVSAALLAACVSEATFDDADDGGPGAGGPGASGGATTGAGGGGAGDTGVGGGAGGAPADVADPEQAGPYAVAELDASVMVPATGHQVALKVAYPSDGPDPGPFPVVVVAHGFQIASSQYQAYATHLASFGYVAVNADFPASFFEVSHMDNALDLLGALDWAAAAPELSGVADASVAGMTGHSLGGKVSLLAATLDTRVRAVVALDPVDSSMSCSPAECPDVSELMPIPIATAFLGETTDASGGFQPCAPAADNYQTFFANTSPPSLEVTLIGANHTSFVNDPSSCGLPCALCNPATVDPATVTTIARAYQAAFYERHLKGRVGYDAYLTGSVAQERYVAAGLATLQSK